MTESTVLDVPSLFEEVATKAWGHAALLALGVTATYDELRDRVSFEGQWPDDDSTNSLELRLRVNEGRIQLLAVGLDSEQRRLLRNVLVSRARLMSAPVEHLILEVFDHRPTSKRLLEHVAGWIQTIQNLVSTWYAVTRGEADVPDDSVVVFWWDGKANFGDAAGPWLIERITGKNAINARSAEVSGPALASVGSVIQMMNHKHAEFWGSGLLYEPNEMQRRRLRALERAEVHAVRGRITRDTLQRVLSWKVPEIYGDPALLFPRYLKPDEPRDQSRIAFLPHRQHMKYFKGRDLGSVSLLNVADDLRDVVNSIASAGACVSTSLHGVIFAQAYGTPWVWLNVNDDELKGGEFKFEDFFTTLNSDAVARYETTTEALKSLSIEAVASRATLPETIVDLDALDEAFPFARQDSGDGLKPRTGFTWDEVDGEVRFVAVARAAYRRIQGLLGGPGIPGRGTS